MHPRNIYKHINFKKLGEQFPEFKKYVTVDLKGRVHLDFKNLEALRTLSIILLKRDFDLNVHFPSSRLVPTIPLRLNYILFIEDLLNLVNENGCINGLDIGTGASCVYPLIAAKKNGWTMVGTDINSDSVHCAQQNVTTNNLNDFVEVIQVKPDTVLEEVLKRNTTRYCFCMCNPPFFGNANELCSQLKRKIDRPASNNAFVAEMHEVLTEGGEVKFVSRIIDESVQFQNRIRIYTSMLGIKRNLKPLLAKLSEILSVKSTVTTEFQQGNTTRFGIAWTFDDSVDLKNLSCHTKKVTAKTKPYEHSIRPFNGTIEGVSSKFREIFDELNIEYTEKREDNNVIIYTIIAYANTWSHNRRKQRELVRSNTSSEALQILSTTDGSDNMKDLKTPNVAHMLSESNEDICLNKMNILKRKCQELIESNAKKSKIDNKQVQDKFLESSIFVHIGEELRISLTYVDGLGGKDASHQVLQYIKNHLQL